MRLPLSILCLFVCSVALSQSPDEASEPDVDSRLQAWIEMLDSPRYSDRAEASEKLRRLGVSAIETLEKVAGGHSVESSDRAFEILKRHHGGEDPIVKAAAGDALQRIADQADHPKSKAAESLMRPDEPTTPDAIPFFLPAAPALPPRALNLNQRIRIQVKINGDSKDITVEENGDKIRVVENAEGIEVEKSDGKGGMKKRKFKDIAELKEKDADAHNAYQRASRGGIHVRRRDAPIAPQLQPPAGLPDDVRKRHEEILKRHHEMRKKHEEEIRERMRRAKPLRPVLPQRPPLESNETLEV